LRILVIHSSSKKSRLIDGFLKAEQSQTDVVADVRAAVDLLVARRYDAIVVDLLNGGFDGASAVWQLRTKEEFAPILAIDGCRSFDDRIRLLEAGADDCLSEPFAASEIAVRLRVLLRRTAQLTGRLRVDDLELDGTRRVVFRQGKLISLTPKEFAVLQFLMRNAGQPVSRNRIVEEIWKRNAEGVTNIVDVYINYLRVKIDRGFDNPLIRTVHGVGYMIGSSSKRTAA
jgi:DNA-binding response OmpR family regulator